MLARLVFRAFLALFRALRALALRWRRRTRRPAEGRDGASLARVLGPLALACASLFVLTAPAEARWISRVASRGAGAAAAPTAAAAVAAGQPASPSPPAGSLAEAAASFRAQRYSDAYGRYLALADGGDATAAWMALFMVTNGPTLFGREWSATPGQLRRWSAMAQRLTEQRAITLVSHDRGE